MTDRDLPAREEMAVDVVIVGAGVAGLATAIALKTARPETEIVVLEKGAEVGAHIVSGAVIDPTALDALAPAWRDDATLAKTPVAGEKFLFLSQSGALGLPGWALPPLMHNRGNFIVSLGALSRWLADRAEALGVEIFPGFAGAELLRGADGAVIGVATGDMGAGPDGAPGPQFQRGMALLARYTVLAEGARGSLSQQAIGAFDLTRDAQPQKYALGIKEMWRLAPDKQVPGQIVHTLGWPLGTGSSGGGFAYHLADGTLSVGLVVHLDYTNPSLSPFAEMQRFKTHPALRELFAGGERLGYGARVIAAGGVQSVPELAFAGGLLVGDSAGFVNLPRVKGSHNAIQSGMLAAEHLAVALNAGRGGDVLPGYDAAWRHSPIGADLDPVRNVKPLIARFGTLGGMIAGGVEMWAQTLFKRSPFGTLAHQSDDRTATLAAEAALPIAYPKPDGVLTFDRLSSVALSGTFHRNDAPGHLAIAEAPEREDEFAHFGGPSELYCPAGVYEWQSESGVPRFVVNAQNCIHCKTCDIKDPLDGITWTVPEGGSGPNYSGM